MKVPRGRNGGLEEDWPGGTRKQSRDTIKESKRGRVVTPCVLYALHKRARGSSKFRSGGGARGMEERER